MAKKSKACMSINYRYSKGETRWRLPPSLHKIENSLGLSSAALGSWSMDLVLRLPLSSAIRSSFRSNLYYHILRTTNNFSTSLKSVNAHMDSQVIALVFSQMSGV